MSGQIRGYESGEKTGLDRRLMLNTEHMKYTGPRSLYGQDLAQPYLVSKETMVLRH